VIPDPASHPQAIRFGVQPIAKINTVVPHYFPFHSDTAPLSPRFIRLTREQTLKLREAGLLICVNTARKLWQWTHRATLKTHNSKQRIGGLVSLSVPYSLQALMASEMARKAA
jgi:hypothetical protein